MLKRLKKEVDLYQSSTDEYVQLKSTGEDVQQWQAVIRGPPDSPFQDYLFTLQIDVPPEYPLVPPNIKFLTRIFHPNIHFITGEICLDILKARWSPAWTLQAACRAIMSMLAEPVPDSPLNCDAGNILRSGDSRAFEAMARLYSTEFATKISHS